MKLSEQEGCQLALDLASFEIVRTFHEEIRSLIESNRVTYCFCNEDEAAALANYVGGSTAEDGHAYLSQYVEISVVTLGKRGCMLRTKGSKEILKQKACTGINVIDATGAGDSFAAGFLFGIMRGHSMKRAMEIGCIAGGAVVQNIGAEISSEIWPWFQGKMHGNCLSIVA